MRKTSFSRLNFHAPLKERYLRCNQAPFMNKEIRKVVTRTPLLYNFREHNSKTAKQQNSLKQQKKKLLKYLDVKKITDNKLFWKKVKPSFSDKTLKDERIL